MTTPIYPNVRYTSREVAEVVLRHSVIWFYENRARLEADGFPRPISIVGRPRWSGEDLLAWEHRIKFAPEDLVPQDAPRSNVHNLSSILAARALAQRKKA